MSKQQNSLIDVWSKARGKRRNISEEVESIVDLTSDELRDVYKGDETDHETDHKPEKESQSPQNSLPNNFDAALEEGRSNNSNQAAVAICVIILDYS